MNECVIHTWKKIVFVVLVWRDTDVSVYWWCHVFLRLIFAAVRMRAKKSNFRNENAVNVNFWIVTYDNWYFLKMSWYVLNNISSFKIYGLWIFPSMFDGFNSIFQKDLWYELKSFELGSKIDDESSEIGAVKMTDDV